MIFISFIISTWIKEKKANKKYCSLMEKRKCISNFFFTYIIYIIHKMYYIPYRCTVLYYVSKIYQMYNTTFLCFVWLIQHTLTYVGSHDFMMWIVNKENQKLIQLFWKIRGFNFNFLWKREYISEIPYILVVKINFFFVLLISWYIFELF